MMSSTNVENISSRKNSFVLGPHFCPQNKHIPHKKMIIRTTCKAVNCFSSVAKKLFGFSVCILYPLCSLQSAALHFFVRNEQRF